MNYLFAPSSEPIEYDECGQLYSHDTFIHIKRSMDVFVLILLCNGTLFIAQNQNLYELHPNQYVILFPGQEHYGYLPSTPGLSYYWCHFRFKNNEYEIISEQAAKSIVHKNTDKSAANFTGYLLPETGTMYNADKPSLIFRLLMDLSQQNYFSKYQGNYALSLLILEIMNETLFNSDNGIMNKTAYNVKEIEEWIHANCITKLSVHDVALHFGYNVNYLSSLFKRHTGYSLNKYIYISRISIAKQMLLNSSDPIKKIAINSGFSDEKQFMKTFKKTENMTPSQYRNLYYKKHFSPQLR